MSKAVGVKFDTDANAAYLRLEAGRVTKTKEGKVDSIDVLFDYRKDGQLIGVEVLNLKKALELYFTPKIPQIQAIAEAKSK